MPPKFDEFCKICNACICKLANFASFASLTKVRKKMCKAYKTHHKHQHFRSTAILAQDLRCFGSGLVSWTGHSPGRVLRGYSCAHRCPLRCPCCLSQFATEPIYSCPSCHHQVGHEPYRVRIVELPTFAARVSSTVSSMTVLYIYVRVEVRIEIASHERRGACGSTQYRKLGMLLRCHFGGDGRRIPNRFGVLERVGQRWFV